MRKSLQVILLLVFCLGAFEIKAQDPQYSQFYAAPLYLNPGFAGSTLQARVGANYRNQWPSINASFVTFSAYFDYFIDNFNSGVGIIVTSDKEGLAGLRSNSLGLQYNYQIRLTEKLTFRPGVEVAYVIRNVDFMKLTFGDQYNPNNIGNPLPTDETFNSDLKVSYPDISFGGVFYSDAFWLGVAVHHITTPNQSFTNEVSGLPMKYSVHAGYKIRLEPAMGKGYSPVIRERSLTPNILYKAQGNFDQLDIGLYYTHEPIVFGLWYRGLPFKPLEGFSNNESVIALIGLTTNGLNIGYSFDYTISRLGIKSGGAHELSVSYGFSLRDPRKPPKDVRLIPCPKF